MAYALAARDCLLAPFNEVPHLFVVLNDPSKDGLCLLAMVSSIKKGRAHDKTCILKPGDHEFIKHDSYIVYRLIETASVAHVVNMVEKKFYTKKEKASDGLYARIVAGLSTSDEVRPSILRYAKGVGLAK